MKYLKKDTKSVLKALIEINCITYNEGHNKNLTNMIKYNGTILIQESDFEWNNIVYIAKDETGTIVRFDNLNGVFPWSMLDDKAQQKVSNWKAVTNSSLYKALQGE